MALTRDGRRLTEAHRRAQLAIAARAETATRILWKRLDVDDIDASAPMWMAANLAVASDAHQQSSALAATYLQAYRDAELGDPTGPIASTGFPAVESQAALTIAGPVAVKQRIGDGMTPADAHASALTGFTGIVRRQVLHGGRMMIHESTRADLRAIGWRRVTDGDPCPFCAMLASRGPVYASRSTTVGNVMRDGYGGKALRYHGYCGCSSETVYGEWIPSTAEQDYMARYDAAAAEVDAMGLPRTEQNIMPILRRDWPR